VSVAETNWPKIHNLFRGFSAGGHDDSVTRLFAEFGKAKNPEEIIRLVCEEVQRQQTDGGAPVPDFDRDENEYSDNILREPDTFDSISQGGFYPGVNESVAVEMPAAPVVDGQFDNHMQRREIPKSTAANPSGLHPSVIGSFSSPAVFKFRGPGVRVKTEMRCGKYKNEVTNP
jgi:hypothetical protein